MLRYMLGHRPDEFGLVADQDGFVPIKDLLWALHEEEGWTGVREGQLQSLVRAPEDSTFEIEGKNIRLAQDESELPKEAFPEVQPPMQLYFAARNKSYPAIYEYGLKGEARPWVVLCPDREMALRIGRRRDPDPILLIIKAENAARKGVVFTRPLELIFLAEEIRPEFFHNPPISKEKPVQFKKKISVKKEPPTPGSFILETSMMPEHQRLQEKNSSPFEKKKKGKGKKKKDIDRKREAKMKRRQENSY